MTNNPLQHRLSPASMVSPSSLKCYRPEEPIEGAPNNTTLVARKCWKQDGRHAKTSI